DKGADLKAKDSKGNTALHFACMNKHEKLASTLIDRGSPVNEQNKVKYTPFHYALKNKLQKLYSKFIEKKAILGGNECTYLHHACYYARTEDVLKMQKTEDYSRLSAAKKAPFSYALDPEIWTDKNAPKLKVFFLKCFASF